MRLTDREIHIIKQKTAECFGAEAAVLLFGSRVDDGARGGDIDLYIELPAHADKVFARSMRLYGTLQIRLGLQRIDIVTHVAGQALASIHREARATGVRL
ncbi:MAG: nucleotidyltransferase domain-containing protein [Gammaproteobacteria bacterium]|nr:nucleotidyltransferase domain-containing protein [Gammaproteobacteria bacterium]NNJ84941.1 nucleotidyltransferase domain-containing protein [Gammaproteobacteria bacterium]